MIYLAFYKHKKRVTSPLMLLYRVLDDVTKLLTRGKYSHCELVIKRSNGLYDCYSASARDGGVRKKVMALPADRWDLIAINADAAEVVAFFETTQTAKYDYLGAVGLVLPCPQNRRRYFCSEWCWAALGGKEGWRFSPNMTAAITKAL